MAKPVITKPNPQKHSGDSKISTISVSATGTPSEYIANNLPKGLSINSSTGAITGTPTAFQRKTVELLAKNAEGTSDPVTFTWHVHGAVSSRGWSASWR